MDFNFYLSFKALAPSYKIRLKPEKYFIDDPPAEAGGNSKLKIESGYYINLSNPGIENLNLKFEARAIEFYG